jgi:hypothetical protein
MFDDLEAAERKFEERKPSGDEQTSPDTSWDDTTPKDTWNNYSATGRLAVVLAGVTFCVLFFPFMSRPWGLPVATLAGYSVLVFSWALRDENCSLGRIEVQELLPRFVLLHIPFLLVVCGIEMEWLRQRSNMPDWLIVEGRKGSLYMWILTALLCVIAWQQARWMRTMVKRKLTEGGPARLK